MGVLKDCTSPQTMEADPKEDLPVARGECLSPRRAPQPPPLPPGPHAVDLLGVQPWAFEMMELRSIQHQQFKYFETKLEEQSESHEAQLRELEDKIWILHCSRNPEPHITPTSSCGTQQVSSSKESTNRDQNPKPATETNLATRLHDLEVRISIMHLDLERLMSSAVTMDTMAKMREELHKMVETVSIKSGLLAISIRECDNTERKNIKNTLTTKQKELEAGPGGVITYTAAERRGSTGSDEDTFEYEIVLGVADGVPLGLILGARDGHSLLVLGIEEGRVSEWNRRCRLPTMVVKPGDRILRVNWIRGYATLLSSELRSQRELRITLGRDHETCDSPVHEV